MSYTFIDDLAAEVEIPPDGTLSRVLHRGDGVRLVVFAFDTDQELTEHTAAVPALLQVISGRLDLTLGEDHKELAPGGWVHMEAHLPHSLKALEPTVMVLTMLVAIGQGTED